MKFKLFPAIFSSLWIGILSTSLLAGIIFDGKKVITKPVPLTLESGWSIKNFDTVIDLKNDGEFLVTEKIHVGFEHLQKHGIYRFIPASFERKYSDGSIRNSRLDIKVLEVKQNGKKATVETKVNRRVNFLRENKLFGLFDDELFLKIGDPDKTISGDNTYEIKYRVRNGLTVDNAGNPQIYWNSTGNSWGVPIEHATVKIISNTSTQENLCFTGRSGSTVSNCVVKSNGNEVSYDSINLLEGEGITVQSTFNQSQKATFKKNIGGITNEFPKIVLINSFIILPLLPFILFVLFWYNKGRKPQSRGIIAPRYNAPDKLTPAQSGYLVDQSIDNVELSGTIIWLAVHGFLKIKKITSEGFGIGSFRIGKSDDYILEKTEPKDSTLELSGYEKVIYDGLFSGGITEIQISSLKEKFYTTVNTARGELSKWAKEKGYMLSLSIKWILLVLTTLGLTVAVLFVTESVVMGVILGIVLVMSLPFIFIWDRRTPEGENLKEEIQGLELYIKTAEKDRINYLNAPERSPEFFEKLLPYAMVLGITDIWADLYQDLYTQPPSWYSDSNFSTIHAFNTVSFANSLNAAATSLNTTLTSSPSSSGGSSGGGGGGGGGGSW